MKKVGWSWETWLVWLGSFVNVFLWVEREMLNLIPNRVAAWINSKQDCYWTLSSSSLHFHRYRHTLSCHYIERFYFNFWFLSAKFSSSVSKAFFRGSSWNGTWSFRINFVGGIHFLPSIPFGRCPQFRRSFYSSSNLSSHLLAQYTIPPHFFEAGSLVRYLFQWARPSKIFRVIGTVHASVVDLRLYLIQ